MSNDKLAATFGPRQTAVVHVALLYDAVCHECGWTAEGNPFVELSDAETVADKHTHP